MKKEKYIFVTEGYLLIEVLCMTFLMEVIGKTDILKNCFMGNCLARGKKIKGRLIDVFYCEIEERLKEEF